MSNEVFIENNVLGGAGTGIIVEINEDMEISGLDSLVEVKDAMDKAETSAQQALADAQRTNDEADQKLAQINTDATQAVEDIEREKNAATTQVQALVDDATEITGLDTVDQAVELALNNGGYKWRTLADMQDMRDQNNSIFEASGFSAMGKHYVGGSANVAINEGLWSATDTSNILRMGSDPALTSAGSSDKYSPSITIAGFTTELAYLNSPGTRIYNQIKFDEAPAGYEVYDSSTGVLTNFLTDVDPNYGDVAGSANEAAARAADGIIPNSDFRLGDVNWYKLNGATIVAGEGVLSGSGQMLGQYGFDPSTAYIFDVVLESDDAVQDGELRFIENSGLLVHSVPAFTGTKVLSFKFTRTDAANTRVLIQCNSSSITVKVKRFAARLTTSEVVDSRRDMFGFEGFLEEISSTNPFVYKHGIIQSQATDIDGVSTTTSNRPDSYYAVYDGDTGSRGKGVNFLAASFAEQDAIASNPKNHIYVIGGKFYQWRIRQRTISGSGNGSWASLDTYGLALRYDTYNRVTLQGKNDLPDGGRSLGTNAKKHYYGNQRINQNDDSKGAFQEYSTSGGLWGGAKGLCYFLVCGTVQRLNQGAYHPTWNPFGTSALAYSSNPTGYYSWFSDAGSGALRGISSAKDCFISADSGGYKSTNSLGNGGISSGKRWTTSQYAYHDAIYSGLVDDLRLPAKGISDTTLALRNKVRMDMVGTSRGVDTVPFTIVSRGFCQPSSTRLYLGGANNGWLGNNTTYLSEKHQQLPDYTNIHDYTVAFKIVDAGNTDILTKNGWSLDTWYIPGKIRSRNNANVAELSNVGGTSFDLISTGSMDTVELVMMAPVEQKAEFNSLPWIDIIGDPERVAATFPNGVVGQWINDIPTGSPNDYYLNRKYSSSLSTVGTYTVNDGATWGGATTSNWPVDQVDNHITATFPVGRVALIHYDVLSNFTELSDNQAPVGLLGSVELSADFDIANGNRLAPSLVGSILKSNDGNARITSLALTEEGRFLPNGELLEGTNGTQVRHTPMYWGAPDNSSDAIKVLPHLVEINEQLFVQYHATQLVYSAGDWGDDSEVLIVNGESTKTDDNGNAVKVVTHTSIHPIGWAKKDI